MPRIDPSRLLKCLTPLLDPHSGAIKSEKEVDKIYGLMSKFSKKLVSKCTYINILKASNTDVLDLFMQRGGWEMIHGWTVDATSNKNHSLLNEIASLLIHTPASIQRLKENDLPRLIKTLSKDCENDVTRELAKKVVAKWISIAKQEDTQPISSEKSLTTTVNNSPVPTSHPHSVLVYNPQQQQQAMKCNMPNQGGGGGGHIMDQQGVNMIGGSGGNAMETESHQEFDSTNFDIGNTDLNDISDFNPEDFSKTIDQHLGELQSEGGPTPEMSSFPQNVGATSNNTVKVQQTATSSQVAPPTPSVIQTTPKITIRTVGGQTTVLNPINTSDQPTFIQQQTQQPVKLEEVTAKQVKIEEVPPPAQIQQLSTQEMMNKQQYPTVIQSTPPVAQLSPVTQNPLVNSTTIAPTPPVAAAPGEKKRRPRKDPSIASVGKAAGKDGIRTYGKNKSPPAQTGGQPNNQVTTKPAGMSPTVKNGETTTTEEKKPVVKKKSSSASAKSAAAAAAAKLAEEEAKLREKIKKEKQMMKQRQKDLKKQQQETKDQETLKKLNLSSGTAANPPSNPPMKIPKIPKKASSFSDAIGIPGAAEGGAAPDKISSRKKDKNESANVENKDVQPPTESESAKKFEIESVKKPEDDEESKKESSPPGSKQRRHRVKVYNSKSSRADDLLKDMTENYTKNKPDAGKEKEKDKVGDPKSITSTSGVKPQKRLSVEGISKPGDVKKLKLSDEKVEKEKLEKKKEEKEKEKEKLRMKEKPKSANTIKESSLFMDMLNAESESQKTSKKKRRLSSGGSFDKEKDVKGKEKNILSPSKQDVVKPTFNFYRDTLADNEENEDVAEIDSSMDVDEKKESALLSGSPRKGAFTPQDDEGRLKSALCIHRVKNKPKKSVRWREEQELKEFHYFEMDETERVNVTKQNQCRDFTAMKQHEKAEEKLFLRRKLIGDPMAEKTEWKKLIPVWLSSDTPIPVVSSDEKGIQDAREKTILGLFLPPGSILPDSALEPDLMDNSSAEKGEPKSIPNEDVNGVTKVCDHRTVQWPAPQGVGFQMPANIMNVSKQFDSEPVPVNNFNMAQNLPMQMPNVSFPPVQAPPAVDFSNPWNNPFSVPVPTSVPPPVVNEWNVGHDNNFVPFGNPNLSMPPPTAMPFGMNAMNPYGNFEGPPPMGQEGFNNFHQPPPGPGAGGPVQNFSGNNNNPPPHNRDQNYSHRGNSGHSSMRGRGGGSRDFDRDRNTHRGRDGGGGGRDRDRNHRDRDHRGGDDWDSRSRDRDRDHRDRDRNRDRDRDHHSRDHDRDRPRGKGKRETLCRFFKRGFCQNGASCEFLHTGPPQNNSHYFGNKDRGGGSHNSHNNSIGGGGRDMNSAFSQMPPQSADFGRSSNKGRPMSPSLFDGGEEPGSMGNNISAASFAQQPPASVPAASEDESTRFSMPPSSPTNELFPPGTEPAKVIPVYSID